MNAELLKAGFILIASAGFLLINFGSKKNFKRVVKFIFRQKEKKANLYISN